MIELDFAPALRLYVRYLGLAIDLSGVLISRLPVLQLFPASISEVGLRLDIAQIGSQPLRNGVHGHPPNAPGRRRLHWAPELLGKFLRRLLPSLRFPGIFAISFLFCVLTQLPFLNSLPSRLRPATALSIATRMALRQAGLMLVVVPGEASLGESIILACHPVVNHRPSATSAFSPDFYQRPRIHAVSSIFMITHFR